ncbi:response regulator [Nostoc sp. UHCC 0302]|uniref:hybrid sensor histidine kinase/response regulator n=1 Tax=Nostoc sp. UHCC 0302 TaxID=3134896 RepID=UPI00311C9C29
MLPEQQQRILGYFIEEARDHLNTIEQGLLNLESTLNDPEMVNEVFRAAHSIKGGAAMLGLTSIQHTSHRLEDCFKVLKEHPVQIDQKLESLFLGVSDTLKALLEHLSGPFGLSEDAANTLMSETEPVFQWLNEHLELLVQQSSNLVPNTTSKIEVQAPSVDSVTTLTELFLRRDIPSLPEEARRKTAEISFSVVPQEVRTPVTAKGNNNWGEFQTQVLQTLREMLQLFKQATTPETRQNLQQCCYRLVELGSDQNLSQWCGLCQAAASAIVNPENSYLTLAKIVITEIKLAQELVLQGREAEITISQQLEALLSFSEIELLEITTDFGDKQPAALIETSTALETVLFSNTLETANAGWLPLQANEISLSKVNENEILHLDEITREDHSFNLQATTESVLSQSNSAFNTLFDHETEVHPINRSIDPNGPEVGIAELNTLADLFEGETPDLDETWQKEEILDITSPNELGIDFGNSDAEDSDSDLSDLLLFDEDTSNEQQLITTTAVEDISLLFGDHFLEKDNSEPQNLQTPATNVELNNVAIPLNLDSSFSDTLEEVTATDDSDLFMESLKTNPSHNDVLEDLLAIAPDDHSESLPSSEVTQPEVEAIASIEPSFKQQNSLDELFLETGNTDWVEKITLDDYVESNSSQSQPQGLSLESLFTKTEEYELPPTVELEIGDLFDLNPTTASEFSNSEDDLSNFWNQETTAEQEELDALIEQDVARDLEESLFAAAVDDIFAESRESLLSSSTNFNLENFGITFQPQEQLDLLFSSDAGDDLFEEFEPSNSTVFPQENSEEIGTLETSVSPQEIRSLLQAPETLDFIPEFTNQHTETSAIDSPQTFADLEIDLFDSLHDSSEDNPQFLFADVSTVDSPYVQVDTTDHPDEDLLAAALEIQPSLLDTTDENTLDNPQFLFADVSTVDSPYVQVDTTDHPDEDLLAAALEIQPSLLDTADENTLDSPQFLFADVPTVDSPYVQVDTTDHPDEDLLAATLEIQPSLLDTADENTLDSPQFLFENDLFFTEIALPEVANQEKLPENEESTENNDLTAVDDFSQTVIQEHEFAALDLSLDESNLVLDLSKQVLDLEETIELVPAKDEENASVDEIQAVEAGSATTEIIQPVALENDIPSQDEFADLEALLEAEAAIPNTTSIPELDFAALEALLGTDNNEATATPNYHQPFSTQAETQSENTAKNVVRLTDTDEFGDLEKLLAEADQTISHSSLLKTNIGKTTRSSTRRAARFEETMKVPVKQLDDMSNLVGELVVNRNTLEQDHERLRQSLDNLLIQVQQLSDVGARMQELYERSLLEASLLAGRKKKDSGGTPSQDSNTDRGFSELEMDRFTPFHTLSQQMIERIVRVRESASDIDFVTEETERVARQFRQVTTQLQEGLTRARMVPFAQTIDRWRRGVRDNAIKCGKQVELVIEGGDTLIDKMILDHLTDPLTHMLNNAIAHGIETPEERQAAGKPPVGIITIRAFHQGNQTVISVGDDGAGIDPERVKAKAVKIGMITQAQAKTMSRLEVYDLLFQSGFTIKDQADEISGRGVGMDVVRSEISEIRGTVNTDSAVGKGTIFTIRLPLTLSICKALCCVSDKARIAFPMDGVEDTLDIPVKNIQHSANGQSFISWRDTLLAFRPLKDLLTFNRQLSRGSVYGGNRDDDMVSVVVVRSGTTLIALQIDQVLSEQEIVIKQFEGPAPKPIGVAGATVLGDGRIMPIADVLEIIDIFQGRISTQIGSSNWQQKTTPTAPEKIDPTVLIVDDSITVRELLSLTFNKAGYRVEQARDGQEAWDKLRSGLPCDIVFCDIEMPRCDGLELLSRIQKDSNLNHLPIAMLTSRGADKHRQMAVQLGASGYFTKPYLEEALLEAATRMLKGEKLVNSTTV